MALRTTCRRGSGLLERGSRKQAATATSPARPVIGQCAYTTYSSSAVASSSSSSPFSNSSSNSTTSRRHSKSITRFNTPSAFASPFCKASFSSSVSRDSDPSDDASLTPLKTTEEVQQWFRQNFEGIQLPDAIALQLITHESWDYGTGLSGHNRRLSFLGRRAMHMFMSLFLYSNLTSSSASAASSSQTSSPSSSSSPAPSPAVARLLSSNDQLEKLLQTSRLGDGVGRALRLEEVMRWRPALSDGQFGPKETGLFKIRGVAVEALVGAIYHQHGAAAARGFFDSRILPRLESLPTDARQELSSAIEQASAAGEVVLTSLATSEATQPAGSLQNNTSVASSSSSSSSPALSSDRSSSKSSRRSSSSSSSSSSHRSVDPSRSDVEAVQERWTLAV